MSDSVSQTSSNEILMDLTREQCRLNDILPRDGKHRTNATLNTRFNDGYNRSDSSRSRSSSSSTSASSSSSSSSSNSNSNSNSKKNDNNSQSGNCIVDLIDSSPQNCAKRPYIIGDELEESRMDMCSTDFSFKGFSFNSVQILDEEDCSTDDDYEVHIDSRSGRIQHKIVSGKNQTEEDAVSVSHEIGIERESLQGDSMILQGNEDGIRNGTKESNEAEKSSILYSSKSSQNQFVESIDDVTVINTPRAAPEVHIEASSSREGSVTSETTTIKGGSSSNENSASKPPKEVGCEPVRQRSSRRCVGKPFKYVPGVTEVAAVLYNINKNSKSWPELQSEGNYHVHA